ncbi:alpha/beta fold hydrolase [Pedobacter rhizosphaerae]|uniref:Pimeloyl-ACP methyl ester carboxylesterase n=1 Tax=Pedobacter rhizosphaerae TaxID=390241 RepID=A0A1H9U4L9_9SPHI|nr:alpha/beta hydrolase [Pedobacter rhizosphaerae]SES04319.1 Pimeloyl-ACP methyl ester carboxylesterase [Pedobacter rhizosphaerae]
MPILKINDREVHIQELNKAAAETVILVHGMFSNLSVYYFSIAPILATQFHVVLYDLKSHGMSEKTLHGYDLNSMTDDLLALMEALNLKKVHLGGYSFGGLIALKMATRFPERIKKLAVIEAPDPSDEKARGIIDEYSREFLEHYVENFTDTTKVKMGKRQMEKNHRMYEYLFYQTSIKQDMINEQDFFGAGGLTRVPHETFLLYGWFSNCLDAGKLLNKKIKNSRLLAIEGDHNIPIQHPQQVADELLIFFKQP